MTIDFYLTACKFSGIMDIEKLLCVLLSVVMKMQGETCLPIIKSHSIFVARSIAQNRI